MQIDWLTTFLAVVDHGGFHAASEATFRAQSRISAHVASLEREVGAVLLDRSARPVQLTDAGSAFVEHARRTVAALQQGKSAIQAVRGLVSGDIILGTYPSAAAAFVPRLLAEYRDAYPGVHVQLHETATVLLDELLEKGPVELALRPTKPATTRRDLTHRLLWRERMVVVHHPLHRLASIDGNLPLAELEGEGLILTGRSFEHDSEPFLMLMERGVSPVVAYVTNQPQTLVSLVRRTWAWPSPTNSRSAPRSTLASWSGDWPMRRCIATSACSGARGWCGPARPARSSSCCSSPRSRRGRKTCACDVLRKTGSARRAVSAFVG
ncbi:LysR family transcriptional regulator [Nonomuraea thailandensis]